MTGTPHAKPAQPAVGKDVQADVREAAWILERERVLRVAAQFRLRQDRAPSGGAVRGWNRRLPVGREPKEGSSRG